MTETPDWKAFFKQFGTFTFYSDGWGNKITPEDLYQAFKARMREEQ